MYAVALIILIFGLVLFTMYTCSKSDKSNTIRTLTRQAARWSTAAIQDQNILIAVLHANYAAGYLWALRDIATDNEIYIATGINILKFRDEIINIQDDITKRLISTCPSFSPSKTYLSQIAGE